MLERPRRARSDLQDYDNQKYIGGELDSNYFEQLISHASILYNSGIDAPDFIPAGAMVNIGMWYDRMTVERGVDMVEQRRRDDIMNSIMVEVPDQLI